MRPSLTKVFGRGINVPFERQLSVSSVLCRVLVNKSSREITFPISGKTPIISNIENACDSIRSGDHVFVQVIIRCLFVILYF
jgi:hypothetical protein